MPGVLVLPLAPELLGLLAALLLAGAAALGYLVGQWFSRAPWPLALIAQETANVFVGTIRLVVTWASDGADNIAKSMSALLLNPYVVSLHAVWAIGDIAASLGHLVQVTIPFIAASYAQTVWGALQAEVADRTAAVSQLYWTAYNWVSGLYSFTVGQLAQLQALAYQLYQAAVARADAGDQVVAQAAQAAAAAVDVHAQQLSQADRDFTRAVGTEALGYAYSVGLALERDLGLAERDLEAAIDAGDRAATGYAQQLAALVAGYAAARSNALATAVQAIEDSPCQRFCSPLGGIGQWVQELEDVGLAAALVALAGAGARDPGGTARSLVETFQGPLTAAAGAIRQEAGV